MRLLRLFSVFIFVLLLFPNCQSNKDFETNWPAWRGPLSTGVAPFSSPPVSWSETSNIRWKAEIPGKGFSTPIVWDDKVFVTTAIVVPGVPDSTIVPYTFKVLALNRIDGSVIWETTVAEEEVQNRIHKTSSHVSNSSVTDGEHLYAYFGSRGLFCLDFNGDIVWSRDFGQLEKRNNFGEGSSPALYKNNIVILWDHEGQSEIFCLDKRTGEDIWQKERDEPSSWSTPLIFRYDGREQVITTASNKIRSYDLESGNIIWECSGLTGNVTPHPVMDNGVLYVMSGYRGNALLAINLADAKDDITDTDAILWSTDANTSYVPSPLLINSRLYFLRSNIGAISSLDALTGAVNFEKEKLDNLGIVYSSPVSANGMIYQTGGSGLTYTLREGPEFEIVSENKLDDAFFSSPGIAGNEIYLRGLKYLYRISED